MESELIKKRQQDLLLFQQIKSGSINISKSITDTSQVCKEVVEENQSLARFLQIGLEFAQPVSYNKQITPATFTVIVDKKLLKLTLQKLLEIGLFLSSPKKDAKNSITTLRVDDSVEIVINFDYYIPDLTKQKELFIPNYGSLNSINNLKLGSGLEGFITKSIADQLNIPIKVITKPEEKQTSFVLYINI